VYLVGPRTPIPRQNVIPEHGDIVPEHVNVHTYPFKTLPLLQSHLHPEFVLIDAGRKLLNLKTDPLNKIFEDFPITIKVIDLYEAWTRPITDNNVDNDPSYNPPKNGDDDDDSDSDDPNDGDYDDKTELARLGYRPKRRASTGIKRDSVKRKRSN
jgi:hypothetical protein